MRNFDTELDLKGMTRIVVGVSQAVIVEPVAPPRQTPPATSRRYLYTSLPWKWDELRDYVVYEIEDRFGPFPRDTYKEIGIFKGFISRWGDASEGIARHGFETMGGYWGGAPISVFRFCANSDPYFAAPIAERLQSAP